MKVSGYISDDYGKSDGATIQLMRNGEGTNLAVVSNQDGYFQIDNDEINEDDIFDIRFLGLKTKSFKASELQDIEIFLEEDIESLDEIVITSNIGKKPKSKLPKKWEEKWYTSPAFVLSTIALVTTGTIIYIIKKTR
jgi:hypothetical protein|tara:strand:+ start:3152 stop:3562 length:411 start_codon:yes stop_codon:yes gene_type:complete